VACGEGRGQGNRGHKRPGDREYPIRRLENKSRLTKPCIAEKLPPLGQYSRVEGTHKIFFEQKEKLENVKKRPKMLGVEKNRQFVQRCGVQKAKTTRGGKKVTNSKKKKKKH